MSDKTRNSIAYLCWMLAAFAFLMFMGPAVKGATKIVPTEVWLPVNADTIRGDYKVILPGVDSVAHVYKDSVFCTACKSVIDSHFVRISGDTLHIWDYYVVYPGNDPVPISWESNEIMATVRKGDGLTICYFKYIDTSAGNPINGVWAYIRDAQGNIVHSSFTSGGGYILPELDSGSFYTAYGFSSSGHTWNARAAYWADSGSTAGSPIQISGYDDGTVPDSAIDPHFVSAYIDLGQGIIDSATGTMIPRTDVTMKLNLQGPGPISDGSWIYMPVEYVKKPDANGRATFSIPANTILTPSGTYWELTAEGRSGRSRFTQMVKRFFVDTIPDPINILDATEVAP